MKIKTLEEFFIHELSDIYNAEKQLAKALPKMAKAATNPELIRAFEAHLKETEIHAERLEQAFAACNAKVGHEKCDAMKGLVTEGEEIIKHVAEGPVRDAALICAAQKVEHYEIATYGTLCALARELGMPHVEAILGKSLRR